MTDPVNSGSGANNVIGPCTVAEASADKFESTTYYARIGETVGDVGQRFGLTEAEVLASNPQLAEHQQLGGQPVKIEREPDAQIAKPRGVCEAPLAAATAEWNSRGFLGRLSAPDRTGWGNSLAMAKATSFQRQCEVEPQQVSARVTDGLTAKLSAYEAGKLSLSPAEAVQLRKTEQLAQGIYHPAAASLSTPATLEEQRYTEQQNLRSANTIGMSLLVPFGLPALADRALGGSEETVSKILDLGFAASNLAAARGAVARPEVPARSPEIARSVVGEGPQTTAARAPVSGAAGDAVTEAKGTIGAGKDVLAPKADAPAGAAKGAAAVTPGGKNVQLDAETQAMLGAATSPGDNINIGPFKDPANRTYRGGFRPDDQVVDHLLARAAGGHPSDPANLDLKPWESNALKAGREGALLKYEEYLRKNGMTDDQIRQVTGPEWKSIANDVHAASISPHLLKQIGDTSDTSE
jgi:hypothetical protein